MFIRIYFMISLQKLMMIDQLNFLWQTKKVIQQCIQFGLQFFINTQVLSASNHNYHEFQEIRT